MSLTSAQQAAVVARGNVLVVAGAGTGKTRTLVARCLHCLLEQPRASLDEILIVTFTDAAAAEMRQRIRAQLEQKLAEHPDDLHWPEQLALFETAHIGTLHGFCLQIVRQHFYALALDPQLTVLPAEEARLLADETLEKLLQEHYAGKRERSADVQELIEIQGRGWDQPVRTLVVKLHHYTQTLRDPERWFDEQLAMMESPEPLRWRAWLDDGLREWGERWRPALHTIGSPKARECAALLEQLAREPGLPQRASWLQKALDADLEWPKGKKTEMRKPLEDFFKEAVFLGSLTRAPQPGTGAGSRDPVAEDWDWARPQMITLLRLAREFAAAFADAKREAAALDFHDLEQHALQLLWDRAANQPTAIAREWRQKLRFVFVDEYQDINDAQDAILKALSRADGEANRFLVGDVKQSIYRFRLADPRVFQGYVETWSGGEGRAIPLVENFRSREAILDFINAVFGGLMRREMGGVPYDDVARLQFGDPANRRPLSRAARPGPRVELHLRLKGGAEPASAPDAEGETGPAWTEMLNLDEADKEARLVAARLAELFASGHEIWDESAGAMRTVRWSDMAVLLRSPSRKTESYAKEFTRRGVPLLVARGGFYEAPEITDLLSLLQLLDNPLQDLPLLAVLHSPLVGLTLDELAALRLILPKAHFWNALQRAHEAGSTQPGWSRIDRFRRQFAAWRRLARQASLSRCLETVLADTHYSDWLLTQPGGEQRHANVQRLLALAQQYDQFRRQGLFRFLRYIDAQQEAETEPDAAAVPEENSVSLMSIHQGKGLEFPVVVVADLGKPFNFSDLHEEIILDEEYGLCPQIKPPGASQRYPSLPYWLARRRQKRETLGEELRLLYVAMTRARDTLVLTGTLARGTFEKRWQEASDLDTARLLAARNYLDWLAAWAGQSGALRADGETDAAPVPAASLDGENALWRWKIYEDDQHLLDIQPRLAPAREVPDQPLEPVQFEALKTRLAWRYPHEGATREPAKTSVTQLRRRLDEEEDIQPFFAFNARPRTTGRNGLSAVELGTAHHAFLEGVSLDRTGTEVELQAEAARLAEAGMLSREEIAQLDFAALAAFWASELGQKIRRHAPHVRRELAFTARFAPAELPRPGLEPQPWREGDFVVVQGVADLAVILPAEIWLVDFKTDRLSAAELPAKVKHYEPQLRLYGAALQRIYRRPVTGLYLYFLALKSVAGISAPPGFPSPSE